MCCPVLLLISGDTKGAKPDLPAADPGSLAGFKVGVSAVQPVCGENKPINNIHYGMPALGVQGDLCPWRT